MARRKIQFDHSKLFFEGHNSQKDINNLVNSPLYPAVISLYNQSNGKVRVGKITTNISGLDITDYPIVSDLGFAIARLQLNRSSGDAVYSIGTAMNPFASVNRISLGRNLSTTNPRYLINRISEKSDHDVARDLRTKLEDLPNLLSEWLRTLVDNVTDHATGTGYVSKPYIDHSRLTARSMTFLAECYAGMVKPSDAPAHTATEISLALDHYKALSDKFIKAVNCSREFFSGDKFIFFRSINGGVVLGSINTSKIMEALNQYEREALPYYNTYDYVGDPITPFKWYPDLAGIPEDIKRELDYSLLMFKTANTMSDLEEQNYIGKKIHVDVGGAYYRDGVCDGIYFLHR